MCLLKEDLCKATALTSLKRLPSYECVSLKRGLCKTSASKRLSPAEDGLEFWLRMCLLEADLCKQASEGFKTCLCRNSGSTLQISRPSKLMEWEMVVGQPSQDWKVDAADVSSDGCAGDSWIPKTIGRLQGCRALSSQPGYQDAVQAESKALESAMLSMKTFGPVEMGLSLLDCRVLSWTPIVAVSVDVTPPPGVRGLPRRTASLPPSHTCNRGRHALG